MIAVVRVGLQCILPSESVCSKISKPINASDPPTRTPYHTLSQLSIFISWLSIPSQWTRPDGPKLMSILVNRSLRPFCHLQGALSISLNTRVYFIPPQPNRAFRGCKIFGFGVCAALQRELIPLYRIRHECRIYRCAVTNMHKPARSYIRILAFWTFIICNIQP